LLNRCLTGNIKCVRIARSMFDWQCQM
jgi:hypothetical protein